MIFYLLPIVLTYCLGFIRSSILSKNSIFEYVLLFLIALIFCCGYMTGSDWRSYELAYNGITSTNFTEFDFEIGFKYLMYVFNFLGFSFFQFLILMKLSFFLVVVSFIRKYFSKIYFPLAIFLSTNALFLIVDNPLRFMIALGIVIYFFDYLIERKFLKFMIVISITSLFHTSFLFYLVIYALSFFQISKFPNLAVLSYVILYFVVTPDFIINLFADYEELKIILGTYFFRLDPEAHNPFAIGRIFYALLFFLTVYKRKLIVSFFSNGELIFTLVVLFFFSNITISLIPTFHRFSTMLAPFFYLSLSVFFVSKNLFLFSSRYLISLYFIVSSFLSLYQTYTYLPYSNYFLSFIYNDDSYNFRSNYNKQKYFKRTGRWPEYYNEDE
jgi:hypothetical protein